MFESIAANPAIPIGRVAYPEDIGKVCIFLLFYLFIYLLLFIVVLVKTLLVGNNDF